MERRIFPVLQKIKKRRVVGELPTFSASACIADRMIVFDEMVHLLVGQNEIVGEPLVSQIWLYPGITRVEQKKNGHIMH